MRKKIAKRKRRALLRAGCKITKEKMVKEPGWPRKQCGYWLNFEDKDGMKCSCGGFDMLETFGLALWMLEIGPEPRCEK